MARKDPRPSIQALRTAPCEALPSAELRTLQEVGHVPMLDHPSGIAHLGRDFIMRATGAGALARAPRASHEKESRSSHERGASAPGRRPGGNTQPSRDVRMYMNSEGSVSVA